MGPLASQRELDALSSRSWRARTTAARPRCSPAADARRISKKGWFVEPTVLGDVSADAPIMNDETFGPVAPLCVVRSFDEALTLANRSRYGLGRHRVHAPTSMSRCAR